MIDKVEIIAKTLFDNKYPSVTELSLNWCDYKEKYKRLRLGEPFEIRVAKKIIEELNKIRES